MITVHGLGFVVPIQGVVVRVFSEIGVQVVQGLGFRGGLVFKAHRLVYHSTLGLRVIKQKKVYGFARDAWTSKELLVLSTRGRANMAHIRQPRPGSGLGFQTKALKNFEGVPSSLGSRAPLRSEEGSYVRLIDFCITQL